MNLVLQAKALKIVNKTAGEQLHQKRSDYITFVCPGCGHRNKMSPYEAEGYKPANEDVIPFKCRMCRTVVEVKRPSVPVRLIMSPDDFSKEMAQRRQALNLRR